MPKKKKDLAKKEEEEERKIRDLQRQEELLKLKVKERQKEMLELEKVKELKLKEKDSLGASCNQNFISEQVHLSKIEIGDLLEFNFNRVFVVFLVEMLFQSLDQFYWLFW